MSYPGSQIDQLIKGQRNILACVCDGNGFDFAGAYREWISFARV
jgi:hypothetical protein